MSDSLKFCGLDTCEHVEAATKPVWVLKDKKGGKASNASYQVNDNSKTENCVITIDSGLIASSEQKKCDYLFVYCEKKYGYFVELKGRDFDRAIKQITSTITALHGHVQKFERIHARIVVSKRKCPNYTSTHLDKLAKLIAKHNGKEKLPPPIVCGAQTIIETIP